MYMGLILLAGGLMAPEPGPACTRYHQVEQAFRSADFIPPEKPAQARIQGHGGLTVDGATYRKLLAELAEAGTACQDERNVTKTQ